MLSGISSAARPGGINVQTLSPMVSKWNLMRFGLIARECWKRLDLPLQDRVVTGGSPVRSGATEHSENQWRKPIDFYSWPICPVFRSRYSPFNNCRVPSRVRSSASGREALMTHYGFAWPELRSDAPASPRRVPCQPEQDLDFFTSPFGRPDQGYPSQCWEEPQHIPIEALV